MTKPLSDEDVLPLREACRRSFEELTELLNDRRISLAMRELILRERNAIQRAWERIPDHFDPQEGGL